MSGYALTEEPGLPRLLAELRAAACSGDLAGVRDAITGLRVVPAGEVGATVAMCWVVVCEHLEGDLRAIELQRRLLNDGLCTSAELLRAIRARAAHHGRQQGSLHGDLFDLVHADPAWAGALDDVTRLPGRKRPRDGSLPTGVQRRSG